MNLLHKRLKHNAYAKKKDWIQTLALEAETAIKHLSTNEKDVYRKLIADRIDTFQRRNPTHKTHTHRSKNDEIDPKKTKGNR